MPQDDFVESFDMNGLVNGEILINHPRHEH
jgi:hypothetical protein